MGSVARHCTPRTEQHAVGNLYGVDVRVLETHVRHACGAGRMTADALRQTTVTRILMA